MDGLGLAGLSFCSMGCSAASAGLDVQASEPSWVAVGGFAGNRMGMDLSSSVPLPVASPCGSFLITRCLGSKRKEVEVSSLGAWVQASQTVTALAEQWGQPDPRGAPAPGGRVGTRAREGGAVREHPWGLAVNLSVIAA